MGCICSTCTLEINTKLPTVFALRYDWRVNKDTKFVELGFNETDAEDLTYIFTKLEEHHRIMDAPYDSNYTAVRYAIELGLSFDRYIYINPKGDFNFPRQVLKDYLWKARDDMLSQIPQANLRLEVMRDHIYKFLETVIKVKNLPKTDPSPSLFYINNIFISRKKREQAKEDHRIKMQEEKERKLEERVRRSLEARPSAQAESTIVSEPVRYSISLLPQSKVDPDKLKSLSKTAQEVPVLLYHGEYKVLSAEEGAKLLGKGEDSCAICMNNKASKACGNQCKPIMCLACFGILKDKGDKCPQCRQALK